MISYLLPSSCHLSFICKNVPYSLGFRLVRIESTREGIEKNLVKLEEELTSQGYRKASVTAALLRARQLNRPDTLIKSSKLTLSLPFDPRLPSATKILHQRHRALLARDVDARIYLPEPPLVTYTRTKNTRNLIFRAKVPGPQQRVLRPPPLASIGAAKDLTVPCVYTPEIPTPSPAQ